MCSKALQGITVLDLTRVLAGPFCAMNLADFGAEVIKIEMPGKGDDTHAFPPFRNGESMYFANINRNKKGITLNLKSEEGKKIFFDMVKKADVVLENYRPGVMDKLGAGYDVLCEINPRIIYAACSGFGAYGRDHLKPGYDIIAQAEGGMMSITGEYGESPLRVGAAIGDVLGGMNMIIGVLLALQARNVTGKGQRVDISLQDSVISCLENTGIRFQGSGKLPERIGNRYASAYPYDAFHGKDGDFVIGCANDKLFTLLCNNVFHMPELLEDKRFSTNAARCENWAELKSIVNSWSVNYTVEEAVNIILGAGVPAGKIANIEQLMSSDHVMEDREMYVSLPHPKIGDMYVNGTPVKLMGTPAEIVSPAPALGQDNLEVFHSMLGYDEEKIEALAASGVI